MSITIRLFESIRSQHHKSLLSKFSLYNVLNHLALKVLIPHFVENLYKMGRCEFRKRNLTRNSNNVNSLKCFIDYYFIVIILNALDKLLCVFTTYICPATNM